MSFKPGGGLTRELCQFNLRRVVVTMHRDLSERIDGQIGVLAVFIKNIGRTIGRRSLAKDYVGFENG